MPKHAQGSVEPSESVSDGRILADAPEEYSIGGTAGEKALRSSARRPTLPIAAAIAACAERRRCGNASEHAELASGEEELAPAGVEQRASAQVGASGNDG